MALGFETGKPLLDCLDLFQLSVPPPFQLAGCKSIPGIHRVVLFEGLPRLIHQLLELAGQGGTLSRDRRCGLLGARRGRPRGRAAETGEEFSTSHSITFRRWSE